MTQCLTKLGPINRSRRAIRIARKSHGGERKKEAETREMGTRQKYEIYIECWHELTHSSTGRSADKNYLGAVTNGTKGRYKLASRTASRGTLKTLSSETRSRPYQENPG